MGAHVGEVGPSVRFNKPRSDLWILRFTLIALAMVLPLGVAGVGGRPLFAAWEAL